MYYDIYKTLSYNCLFNFIVGNRGGGKTYAFKYWAIKDFLKTGNQFVYVRRYKQELKKCSKFFDDIIDQFPDCEFKVKGKTFYINGEIAGNAIPLSTAKIEKSVPFPETNKICFDEFILDKGFYHYLPDEVTNFLELYETIARLRDVTCFFLANAVSVTNPYFLYFNVSLPYNKKVHAKNDILIEMVQNQEFINKKKETRFAKIIQGTEYEKYAIENEFLRDNKIFIAKKTPNAEYYFTMIYNSESYGVWVDYKAGYMFVSYDVDPSCKLVYATTTDDHKPNTLLMKGFKRSPIFSNFLNQYKLGAVRFENVNIKNICQKILSMTL